MLGVGRTLQKRLVTLQHRLVGSSAGPSRIMSPKRAAASKGGEQRPTKKASTSAKPSMAERLDPKLRGIHKDAIHAERATSSRAECVDCARLIGKDEPRWGVRYAGNPLSMPVIPLYGTFPIKMYMWCHAGCGLSFIRLTKEMPEAARVCHYCSDTPDDSGLRLLCGGKPKGTKIRQHAFHVRCWKDAIEASGLDEEAKKAILIDPTKIRKRNGGIGWGDLTDVEKDFVLSRLAG